MAGPYDYSTPLAAASQLPQPQEGAAILNGIQQGLALQYGQQQRAYEVQQLQRNLSLQQQADTARTTALQDPTADNIVRWTIADPANFQAAKTAHDSFTSDAQQQNIEDGTAAFGYAQAGNWDGVAKVLQRRVDAGQTNLQPLINMVQSGDPKQQAAAQGVIGAQLAGWMGPDKFADAFNATSPQALSLKTAQANEAQANANKANADARYHTVGLDQTLVDTGQPGDTGGASAQGQPSPTQGGSSPTPAQSGQQPRGVRNNNPLNVSNLPDGKWAGQTGSDGQYAVFSTPQAGWAAADKNLQSYAKNHGINTVAGIVSRWAPESGGNNTAAYIGTVAGDLGVQPNQPLDLSDPNVRQRVLRSMSKVELGGQYASTGGGAPAPQAAATPAAPQGGPRVVYSGAAASGAGTLSPQAVEQHAQEYVATGQMPDLGRTPMAGMQKAQIINRAAEIEAANGQTGYDVAARRAAVSSNQGALDQVTKTAALMHASEQTVLKNMDLVTKLAPKGAGPTGSPLLNSPIQGLRKGVWGSDQVAAFDQAIGSTADEYATVMGKGTPSVSARDEAYQRLSKAATVGQLKAIMGSMRKEMENQTASYASQRDELIGSLHSAIAAGGSPIPQPKTPAEAKKLGSGITILTPDGRMMVTP